MYLKLKYTIVIIIIGIFTFGTFLVLHNPHQNDESMIRDFRAQQKDFEELLTLFRQDEEVDLIYNYNQLLYPNPVFNYHKKLENRNRYWEKYKLILEKLELEGIHKTGDTDIWFVSSSSLFMIHGSKGYLYTSSPETFSPFHLVNSLDNRSVLLPYRISYRHIEGNWYLFYDDYDY